MADVGVEFETERLVVRGLQADDLEALLDVFSSNPGYLELTEGSGGEPGRYDVGMLQRDLTIARLTPGRRMMGIFLRQTGEPVGVLDWMEEKPADAKPWLGLLMIRADSQRQGLASEAFAGLAGLLRARGASAMRGAVIQRDAAGRAFARSLGFETVSTTVRQMASKEDVVVLERAL